MKAPERTPVFDARAWPDKLVARVVTPGPSPRLAGYDVEGDLAAGWSFSAITYLGLTGELPGDAELRAFDAAMIFLAPCPVNEAPAHAAVLARVCAAEPRAITGTAAIALAEQAAWVIGEHRDWLRWLDAPDGAPPEGFAAGDDAERSATARLAALVGAAGLDVPALAHRPARVAAILAVLHACGLRRSDQLERAWTMARLPATLAEAMAAPPASFKDYPFDLPRVDYQEPR